MSQRSNIRDDFVENGDQWRPFNAGGPQLWRF